MENTDLFTENNPPLAIQGIPTGYQHFVSQLQDIGVDPKAAIDFLKTELVKLAKEKKAAGYSYQEFHDLLCETGFECVYYPDN